jgi:hypothetical protein
MGLDHFIPHYFQFIIHIDPTIYRQYLTVVIKNRHEVSQKLYKLCGWSSVIKMTIMEPLCSAEISFGTTFIRQFQLLSEDRVNFLGNKRYTIFVVCFGFWRSGKDFRRFCKTHFLCLQGTGGRRYNQVSYMDNTSLSF